MNKINSFKDWQKVDKDLRGSRRKTAHYWLKYAKERGLRDWKSFIQQQFPYSIPKNYLQWDELSEIIGISLALFDLLFPTGGHGINPAASITHQRTALWATQSSPVFVVTPELMDVFAKTQISQDNKFLNALIDQIDILFPTLILLFPKNRVINDFETGFIDYTVLHTSRFDKPEWSVDNKWGLDIHYPHGVNVDVNKYKTWINWCGISTSGSYYFSARGVRKDKGFDPSSFFIEHEQMKQSALTLREVVLQSLLLICSKPELLTTADPTVLLPEATRSKGFSTPREKESSRILRPRVLGLNYVEGKIKRGDSGRANLDSRGRMITHWRTGYDVDKPIGPMKNVPKEEWQRKKITVLPYLVLGEDSE